ncbi:MAG: DUF4365 domain-containing protein [Thermodesulfobacteriota bacterium]
MADKKRRVRKHVIADLSVNHVEYHVLKAGYTMDTTKADYGYDGVVLTFDSHGEIENGNIFVQLKATDLISRHKKKDGLSFSVSKKDITLWHDEPFPVYLVLFDAAAEKAYWLYFQKYLTKNKITPSRVKGKYLAVHIDDTNIFNSTTPKTWRLDKEKALSQLKGVVTHG